MADPLRTPTPRTPTSTPSTIQHPFANSKSQLEIIPSGIDVEEESRLYDALTNDPDTDAQSIHSIASFQAGPPSVFSKDIWLGDNSGSRDTLAFAQDVRIAGWTSVGDKPEGSYIVYDCVIRTKEGTTIHAHKRYSDFDELEFALQSTLPVIHAPLHTRSDPDPPIATSTALRACSSPQIPSRKIQTGVLG
ncbi:hypothetical protein C0991_002373 [Blastosporella zonata]|nr:hypothetical protein C0991_002373 [Blastosporella zonata]